MEKIVGRLREALSMDEGVLLAYIFGSRAEGVPSPLSDYDVAVLMRDNDLRSLGRILFAVSKALEVSEDLVDILDLKRAPLHLKARALKGVKLVDRGYEKEILEEVNRYYPEISIEDDKMLAWWLKNPESIDAKIVKEHIDHLNELTHHISRLLGRLKPGDLERDAEAWHALKSMVQDAAQAVIDVCGHITTAKGLGPVVAYREFVEKLVASGLMEEELGEGIKTLIVVRNRLIHRYLHVTPEELRQEALELRATIIPRFREWLLTMIQKDRP